MNRQRNDSIGGGRDRPALICVDGQNFYRLHRYAEKSMSVPCFDESGCGLQIGVFQKILYLTCYGNAYISIKKHQIQTVTIWTITMF